MALTKTQSDAADFYRNSPLLASTREISSGLATDDRQIVARQLGILLSDFYVHLPLKRSSLAIDPVQEANLLADEVRFIYSEGEFFQRMFAILKRLRDRHTAVRLPSPWRDMVAYLPFAVESFYDESGRHLIVSKVMVDLGEPTFAAGVEITHWNGSPIARYVQDLSQESDGAHPFSRIAVTLRALTVRPLGYMAQPREDWVTLTYVANGRYRSAVIPWRIYVPSFGSAAAAANTTAAGAAELYQGIDRNVLIVNNTWFDLYSARDRAAATATEMADNVVSRTVQTPAGEFGYIRIFSFAVADPAAFVSSFADTLRQLPARGVIIDLRGNPGGSIPAGEGLLQLFTSRTVSPQPVSFRTTAATRQLGALPSFAKWKRSLDMQYETGEVFSQGYSLTPDGSGPRGVYRGPVVLIIDALCYSTTDFFAAGMQDNGLAAIIGVDPVSGAGGANVWSQTMLGQFAANTGITDFMAMPSNVDIDIAMRRSIRVGPNEGLPVEGLGVFADHVYQMTRNDVLGQNEDLIDFAGQILASRRP